MEDLVPTRGLEPRTSGLKVRRSDHVPRFKPEFARKRLELDQHYYLSRIFTEIFALQARQYPTPQAVTGTGDRRVLLDEETND